MCLSNRTETDYSIDDGAVIYALAWPQGVGCAIMGLALARRNELITMYVGEITRADGYTSYPPFYTFLTTGKLFQATVSMAVYRRNQVWLAQ
jgi:hypothetical protein